MHIASLRPLYNEASAIREFGDLRRGGGLGQPVRDSVIMLERQCHPMTAVDSKDWFFFMHEPWIVDTLRATNSDVLFQRHPGGSNGDLHCLTFDPWFVDALRGTRPDVLLQGHPGGPLGLGEEPGGEGCGNESNRKGSS